MIFKKPKQDFIKLLEENRPKIGFFQLENFFLNLATALLVNEVIPPFEVKNAEAEIGPTINGKSTYKISYAITESKFFKKIPAKK